MRRGDSLQIDRRDSSKISFSNPGDMTAIDADDLATELARARRTYREDADRTLLSAMRCHQAALALGDSVLAARAIAMQGQVALQRGDIRSGLTLALEAEHLLAGDEQDVALAEIAALRAEVSFFTGAYSEALLHAERCIAYADQSGDLRLRIFVRRAALIVFGNVAVRELDGRLHELLELSVEAADAWEEAITHNDIACFREAAGDAKAARESIAKAFEVVQAASPNRFALAVIHSTSADVWLRAGEPQQALDDAERSLQLLAHDTEPNPYVLGASVHAQVKARIALGRFDEAQHAGEETLIWLGDRLPRTRSVILGAVAQALREAGRIDAAYDTLLRSAELERRAVTEISELQLSLERATLQAHIARNESDALAVKNRELAEAHTQLETRTRQLEALQEQLRDQAERDWLTGVHNRRFLARELARPAAGRFGEVLSVAVVDLDHFKAINDRFGHSVGDLVLVRAAALLCEAVRTSDTVVRSGGEEFLLLMPHTSLHAAKACCERVRESINSERWDELAPGLTLSTSIGVATAGQSADLEALVKLADHHLYVAKDAGRNRVVAAPAFAQS
jgi:diguanylate cyclase (GGDEF)-like protein